MKYFLTPALLGILALSSSFAADWSLKETPNDHLDVLQDGKVVARFMTAYDKSTPARLNETYKPYLHIFDAEGTAPITKGAGGDFTHHRGIFEGWMKIGVNGRTYDRWHMKGGEQIHQKFLAQKADAKGASFTSLVKWNGEGDEAILEDERTFTFLPAPAPYYAVVDVTTKIKALAGDTTLDGDPEHSGLQFRPAQEVDRSKTTYIYAKEKADVHKDVDYPWFGETFSLNGKSYSVVYLNHPENPKEARISAYRDYGRFGVFFKTSIPKGETLTLKVRFLIAQGELPTAEAIQKSWNAYTGKNEPTPAFTLKPAEMAKPAAPKPAAPDKPKDAPVK